MANPSSEDKSIPSLIITFSAGLNENQNPDISESATGGNFDLSPRQSALTPRQPFDLVGTAPGVLIYATLDPSNTQATVTLSNSNLTAQSNTTAYGCSQATIGISTGKWYWEVTMNHSGNYAPTFGLIGSGQYPAHNIGQLNYTAGFVAEPGSGPAEINFWFSSIVAAFLNSPNIADGDTYGFAIDADAETLSGYYKGTLVGTINLSTGSAPLTKPFYPAITVYEPTYSGSPVSVTCNFGASPFVYTVPSGYNSGLYTTVGSAKITSIMQMITRAGSKTQLVVAGTNAYNWLGGNNVAAGSPVVGSTTTGIGPFATSLLAQAAINTDAALLANDTPSSVVGVGTVTSVYYTVGNHYYWRQYTISGSGSSWTYGWSETYTFSVVTAWNNVGSVNADALLRASYWALSDYLVITDINMNNNIKMWDGITFQDMPTGISQSVQAKYSIIYLSRLWLFNVTSGTPTPHLILASGFETPQNLNLSNRGGPLDSSGTTFNTGLEPFYLLVPDLRPINGVSLFQNSLIISTLGGMLWQLTGQDASTFAFVPFFVGSSAVGSESVINIGNDVLYMRQGGNINALSFLQSYGDVESNDIARWIPNTTNNLPGCITCYEPAAQKVYFAIQNKILVLFKDVLYGQKEGEAVNQGNSPWSVYTTSLACNMNTVALTYMQYPNNVNYTVMFGDDSGNIYDINGVGLNGDGGTQPINMVRQTKIIDIAQMIPMKYQDSILSGKVQYRKIGATCNLVMSFTWLDELNTSSSTIPIKGSTTTQNLMTWNNGNHWGGGSYWGSPAPTIPPITHQTFSPTGKGAGFYLNMQISTNTLFELDHIEFY